MPITIIVMAKECLQKQSQFLQFPLLRKQGKPVIYNDDIYCTIYYSKHGASDVEYFEMSYNHSNGKEMTAKKQGQP